LRLTHRGEKKPTEEEKERLNASMIQGCGKEGERALNSQKGGQRKRKRIKGKGREGSCKVGKGNFVGSFGHPG